MAYYLQNRSYPGALISSLGYPLSVAKPDVVQGSAKSLTVKPVLPWQRHFITTEECVVSGRRVVTFKDGSTVRSTISYAGTGLADESSQRWLPGTPTAWATSSASCPLWNGLGEHDFDGPVLSAIAEAKTKGMDLGTILAERKKTVELIKRLVPNLVSQTRNVLKSLVSNDHLLEFMRNSGTNGAGAVWLHARYGLRPLVYDIVDAHERYTRLSERLFRVTQRGNASRIDSGSFDPGSIYASGIPAGWTRAGGQPASPIAGKGFWECKRQATAICGIGVLTAVRGKFTVNPGLTAWETVPYSFVLDWVLNIGTNIKAWSPVFDRSLGYGWLALKEEFVYSSGADFSGTNLYCGLAKPVGKSVFYIGRAVSDVKCLTTIRGFTFRRIILDLAHVPFFLGTELNLDWMKATDLAALCNANRRSLRKSFPSLRL